MRLIFILCACMFAAPLFYVCVAALQEPSSYFSSLYEVGLLQEYVASSLMIGLGTTVFAGMIGMGAAWLVTFHHFPCRRLLTWLLILPLATPSYIAAMFYAHLLEGAGVVQQAWRAYAGVTFGDYWFPPIRSVGGAIFVLSFTLYPYVYMVMRAAFLMQSPETLHSAMVLGCSRPALLRRVLLPMARPAIIAGAALVMMEALADFGVSSLFGVSTLTTGLYRAWNTMLDYTAAARLALLLAGILLCVLVLEKSTRRHLPTRQPTSLASLLPSWRGAWWQQGGYFVLCALPVLLGFVIPLLAALYWSVIGGDASFFSARLWNAAKDSVGIASSVALLTTMLGSITAYMLYYHDRHPVLRPLIHFVTSAYGFSGSVIAISVLLTLLWMQHAIGGHIALLGTYGAILWGCSLRFLTISHHTLYTGLQRIPRPLEEAAMLLGCTRMQLARTIHFPLLRTTIVIAGLLVFIDTLKELPATLLLRPFNMTTLSIRIYELAKDEMLAHAAPLALILLLVSTLATLFIQHHLTGSAPRHAKH